MVKSGPDGGWESLAGGVVCGMAALICGEASWGSQCVTADSSMAATAMLHTLGSMLKPGSCGVHRSALISRETAISFLVVADLFLGIWDSGWSCGFLEAGMPDQRIPSVARIVSVLIG